MLQQDHPEDDAIATGEQHSVRTFVDLAAAELRIPLTWRGKGIDEKGYDQQVVCRVAVDPRYFRPTEVESLLGDASKARRQLGWTSKSHPADLVRKDFKTPERDELVKTHGYHAFDHHE